MTDMRMYGCGEYVCEVFLSPLATMYVRTGTRKKKNTAQTVSISMSLDNQHVAAVNSLSTTMPQSSL